MRIGIFGGTFNPPHLGHVQTAQAAAEQLGLDKLIVVPTGLPPHKELPEDTPPAEKRMEMVRIAFSGVACAEVSDIELIRDKISYTADTADILREKYPDSELFLIVGTDMFCTLESWNKSTRLLSNVIPAVLSRGDGDAEKIAACSDRLLKKFGVNTEIIQNNVIEISSSRLRSVLPQRSGCEYMDDATYGYIVRNKLYGVRPNFEWLRYQAYNMLDTRRILHVAGCEEEALRLAKRWGENEDDAREAAILHDTTKRADLSEQLRICEKYGIMTDNVEKNEVKLLHSKTGAAIASAEFGATRAVHDAILWHTTGKADMSLLEKIIYMADYIEPGRSFEGIDILRRLAYEDLNKALLKGLEMSIEDMEKRGIVPHCNTSDAISYLLNEDLAGQKG